MANNKNLDWESLARQRALRVGTRPAKTLAELAQRAAVETPDDIAFIDGARSLSFAAVYEDAVHLSAALSELGLRPGDVLSFQLPNWAETAVINLAACLGGLVCNPIVPIYREAELAMILADCRSRALFVPGFWRGVDYDGMARKLAARVPSLEFVINVRSAGRHEYAALVAAGAKQSVMNALPSVSPDSVKFIMYTSGTTGPAKGVLHSHRSLPIAMNAAVRQWGLQRGDCLLMPSPVTHATGYTVGLELPFSIGTTTVLMERWNAPEAAALIERHRIAAAVGATPFLQELLEAMDASGCAKLPLGKVFVCGGAAVPSELILRAGKRFDGYACRGYGSTEAPFVTFGRRPEDTEHIGACTDGRINGYEVRIVDANDREVPSGSEGEILVLGDGLFLGYANPDSTREAFTEDGYFRTGDIGFRAADGDTLTITGRKKDLIIRGGENISAKEIEDVLHRHPLIVEAAVVSAPHARMGESIAACVRTRDGARVSVEELAAHVLNAGLARQKCPEHVRVVDELPRTAAGKIRKDVLRGMIRAELSPARDAADEPPTGRDDPRIG